MKSAKTAEEYILAQFQWQNELIELRKIMQSAGLVETIKWGIPVYTFKGKNIAGMASFKHYAAIWFYQGALLKDKHKKLINAQEGTTKALRQWRFKSFEEIDSRLVLEYLKEAIENEKTGHRIEPKPKSKLEMPEELEIILSENSVLTQNFTNLTPFKQREYIEFISEAKKPETRQKRIEKIIPILSEGIGLNDKYR
jgi:uncharacterized protein YdeI (YjbR/CyaY-like superfamily)